ncbi:hypothetical protein ACFV8Z_52695 [Streptomyces sp. NPDC059837]|uniref:hypothetical protein n=1 Tax=unclassified Streptomyces TaxID=2593676 RepID=UPI003647977D
MAAVIACAVALGAGTERLLGDHQQVERLNDVEDVGVLWPVRFGKERQVGSVPAASSVPVASTGVSSQIQVVAASAGALQVAEPQPR